jgi:hypothetical protein
VLENKGFPFFQQAIEPTTAGSAGGQYRFGASWRIAKTNPLNRGNEKEFPI